MKSNIEESIIEFEVECPKCKKRWIYALFGLTVGILIGLIF